jgi:hypothetical protein
MKTIKFYTDDSQVMKDFPPRPIQEDLPNWLTSIKKDNEFNITHCKPAMDWMSSGYVIYNAWEIILKEKIIDFTKGVEYETQNSRIGLRTINPSVYSGQCLPVPGGPQAYFKIETDFKVVTPPGYSCLVMQPYYDFNKDYKILPGVIDTDKHDWVISAMGHITNPNIRILPGERMIQIIPYKRDGWTMELHSEKMYSQLFHYVRGAYKKLFHTKKVYK